jgi:plasmid maintenance system antidote protein VapI
MSLARYFGGDAYSWLNLQQAYDLKMAEQIALAKITKEVQPREAEHA